MLQRLAIAALALFALSCDLAASCSPGLIQITDPFLNPDGSAWSGNYLAYVNHPLIAYTMDAVSQMGETGGNVYITTWYYTFTVQ